ncbi:hypothetical protein O6H91_20G074900 [Diphasiastrum complanatum]|uniref:Uncharacterized protein n=2 Tax=Diphasiastrum complanatum TaxID=34168 RepID=A0ACC2ARW1_DIPCM|nr:hypothetical protein O6H91_20G074900 [Diphasiastrum complanatum]KAJ7520256.1 hypothetical protein O6H91_20G074900 [Diphasiastrum complanatum]
MDKKMNFATCSISKALITTLAGIGLLLVLIQLLDSLCPCASNLSFGLPPWQQSSSASTVQQQVISHIVDNSLPIAGKTTLALEESIPLERQDTLLSSEDGSNSPYANSSSVTEEESQGVQDGRQLQPYGVAAHLFVHLGSYRGGPRSFATVGLASKPLHVFGTPGFDCEWIPARSNTSVIAEGSKMLPDWGFGRIYTVVVVNCSFHTDVGTDSEGGQLVLHAYSGDGFGKPVRISALNELKGHYNSSRFIPPYPYKYLYCGSPLYGSINPSRLREWMVYHAWLLGASSYFVLYDAGGLHSGLKKVLDPWIKLGRVKIESVQEQKKYDGYYYNQFLFVNDCLHKYRFMADWTFFFDVDEYVYIPPGESMDSVLDNHGASQILIEQRHISDKLCLLNSDNITAGDSSTWGIEKLVFNNVKKGHRWNRKYVINARNAFAAGVHLSQNLVGKTVRSNGYKLRYYHYHNTISYQGELCREYIKLQNDSYVLFEGDPYKYDERMKALVGDVKEFERKSLGLQLDMSV